MTKKNLYVVTCATLAARYLDAMLVLAKGQGWNTWVIGTLQSREFIDIPKIERITGNPTEFEYRHPDTPRKRPKADAVAVVGASFNMVNKWAYGIADNLALSLLSEVIGYDIPVALLPFVNEAMSKYPALDQSIETLRQLGVNVVYGPGINEPHPPHTAKTRMATYPWHLALDVLGAA